jgi:hypothetical protein
MQNADTALRLLTPRPTLLGTGDADSLQNVNTTELPNGALCWVVSNATLYRLDAASTAASAPDAVIVPAAGPGRWIALSGNELIAEGRMSMRRNSGDNATVVIATINVWTALPVEVGPSYFPQVPGAAFWSIAPTTGVATYSGPNMIYHFNAAMNLAAGETATVVAEMALTVNNEDIGTTAIRDLAERVAVGTTTSFEGLAIANAVALATGDTIQLIARNTTGTEDLIVDGIQIIGIPVGTV